MNRANKCRKLDKEYTEFEDYLALIIALYVEKRGCYSYYIDSFEIDTEHENIHISLINRYNDNDTLTIPIDRLDDYEKWVEEEIERQKQQEQTQNKNETP